MTSGFSIDGWFYPGGSSRRLSARLRWHGDGTVVIDTDDGDAVRCKARELDIPPRVGDSARLIVLPGGSSFETRDNDAVDLLAARSEPDAPPRIVHVLESRWPYVFVALLVIIAASYFAVAKAVPFAAEKASRAVPERILKQIGVETLKILDGSVFGPSRLGEGQQRRLRAYFGRMAAGARGGRGYGFNLQFRRGNAAGANAFALPDGTIVVTDELVEIASGREEVGAVLAHEMGHVVHRHGLRMVIQDSVVTVAVMLITGDVLSASSVAAALPAVLVRGGYSREFEREADVYAYRYMKEHGMDPASFISMLEKLEERHRGAAGPGLLSTHPSYEQRARIFRGQR